MDRDPQELWARCLLNIERRVQAESFDNWFRPTRVRDFTEDTLVIEVPTSFFAEWLDRYYLGLIKEVVREEMLKNPSVSFVITESPADTVSAENPAEDPQ